MFLALIRTHFNPRYARAKMSLTRAKNIFMPANINSIVILKAPRAAALRPNVTEHSCDGRGWLSDLS